MGGFGVGGLWLWLALALGVSVGVALGSVWLSTRTMSVSAEQNSSLSPFLTVVGLVFGALLGFTVVVAWEQFSSAKANVAHEASTLTTMYRQTVGIPDPLRTDLRQQLRRYAEAAKGPGWETQDRSAADDNPRAAITEMYRLLGNQPSATSTPITGEFLSELTVLATDLNQRALDGQSRIPPLMWAGLLFGGVLLVAVTGFMRLDTERLHPILSSGVAVLLGLLLFIVYFLDHPFRTDIGVTPAPFRQSVGVFDVIDRGQ